MDKKHIGEKLRLAMDEKGIGKPELARLFSVRVQSVNDWLAFGRIAKKHLPLLIEYFNKPLNYWMESDVVSLVASTRRVDERYILLDRLEVTAGAGTAISQPLFYEVVEHVEVLRSWASTAFGGDLTRIKLVTARGTSMQGTIENGDVMFVDTSVRFYDGDGIYLISRDNDMQVKRLQRLNGGVLAIISDNRAYEPERLTGDDADSVVVCGRVMAGWTLKKFW